MGPVSNSICKIRIVKILYFILLSSSPELGSLISLRCLALGSVSLRLVLVARPCHTGLLSTSNQFLSKYVFICAVKEFKFRENYFTG